MSDSDTNYIPASVNMDMLGSYTEPETAVSSPKSFFIVGENA